MATYNITVLSSSSSGNGYRFSGTDKSGSISSSTSNPTINITTGVEVSHSEGHRKIDNLSEKRTKPTLDQ
jgi:hypothetical protein